jgi:TAG lipase/steryl ester hydrolase/phospholipase A2/LPA acyltransferase
MDQSRQYDYTEIRMRLDRLRSLRVRNDHQGLLFALNEGIHGNMGGMGRSSLYRRARFGTKRLIEQYIAEIDDALRFLADLDSDDHRRAAEDGLLSTGPISASAARR